MADSSDDLHARLNEHAISLEAEAEQQEAEAAVLAAALAEKKDNIRRIREAVAKLRGQDTAPKKRYKVDRIRAATRTAISNAVEQAGEEGTTLARLVAETGISRDTTRRALNILRTEQVIRAAGVNDARENVYKPMPKLAMNGAS